MIEKLKLTPEDEAALRHLFEHKVFGQYFLSQISRTGLGGPLEFLPDRDTMDMQTFIRRDEDGHYTQEGVEPAWWAFKEAAMHTSAFPVSARKESSLTDSTDFPPHQETPVNADAPSILVPADFGAPFEGGFYGGRIRSGEKIFAVAWAPKALGETQSIWLPGYKDVPNAASCFHSMDNTIAMAEAGSPLAQWARGLNIDGKTDWCIPARDVLELAYRNLKPTTYENSCSFRDGDNPSSMPAGYLYTEQLPAQTTAEAFRKGGSEAFEPTWYWSSTQYSSSDAWGQYFDYGYQGSYAKKFEARARAVRLIQLGS